MFHVQLELNRNKQCYLPGEMVEGMLHVTVSGNETVTLGGLFVYASSTVRVKSITGKDVKRSELDALLADDEEPGAYKQHLQVAGGDYDDGAAPAADSEVLRLTPGTHDFPFSLVLPPDLQPSYHCCDIAPKDQQEHDKDRDTFYVANNTYYLRGDVLPQAARARAQCEPVIIYVLPTPLPPGPPPREGFIRSVVRKNVGGAPPSPQETPQSPKKGGGGCCGGGATTTKAAPPQRPAVERLGQVRLQVALERGYVCIPHNAPNDTTLEDPNSGVDPQKATEPSKLKCTIKVINESKVSVAVFMLVSLKIITVFHSTEGRRGEVVSTVARRLVKAVRPPPREGDEILHLQPGETTTMSLTLELPQKLELSPPFSVGDAAELLIPDNFRVKSNETIGSSSASHVDVPYLIPPTMQTDAFEVRTRLEVDLPMMADLLPDGTTCTLDNPIEFVARPYGV